MPEKGIMPVKDASTYAANAPAPRAGRLWLLLLALPYLGLCFPAVYARTTPALFGFPFFYWYQFAWVVATSGALGTVYLKVRLHR